MKHPAEFRVTALRLCAAVVFICSFFLIGAGQKKTAPIKPKLAVVIVVDQMRPDYLTRFDKLYKGGFRRLLDHGAIFLNAFHDHAATETAVGHTTISTGRFPSHHGIIGNEYWDRAVDTFVYCMGDTSARVLGDSTGERVSSKNIDGPTIGDLLKEASPSSKVISISLKDRGSIGLAGHSADGAYWYSRKNGNYVTSTGYMPALPAWVDSFNTARLVDSYFVAGWQKLLPDKRYMLSDPDSTAWEYNGKNNVFPHLFTEKSASPDEKYYSALYRSPFSDLTSLSLARAAVQYEQLGADSIPDLLLVSCSAADAIGHAYGPMSQEAEDYYLRLDKGLGEFFSFLDKTVGKKNYVLTLCADHATMLAPEDLQKQGVDAGRLDPDSVAAQILGVGQAASAQHFRRSLIRVASYSDIIIDTTLLRRTNYTIAEAESYLGSRLKDLSYIADYYTRYELSTGTPQARPYWEQYWHCYRPDRGPDLFIRFKENYVLALAPTATTHGSPYWYDANVPIIFMGPGITHRRYQDKVRTVSIAPTLSELLQIPLSPNFDGQPLKQVLGQ